MGRMAALALISILVAGSVASSAEEKSVRSISVTGTAETKIPPDQIVWSITLTDTDKNLLQVKKSNDERVKAVLALRKQLEVGEGDAETGVVSVRREYEHDSRGNQGNFKGFRVTRYVTIRERDLKRFDEFLASFVASTEMEVDFRFESSHRQEIRAETRLKALQAAKDKAAAMAVVAGAKLGRVLTINEHMPDRSSILATNNRSTFVEMPTIDFSSDTFVPGTISEQVTVNAVFELE